MVTLPKVGLDVWSHFQKWDWMFGHTFKSAMDVHIFKSGIGCMVTLSKVGLDVVHTFKVGLDV